MLERHKHIQRKELTTSKYGKLHESIASHVCNKCILATNTLFLPLLHHHAPPITSPQMGLCEQKVAPDCLMVF